MSTWSSRNGSGPDPEGPPDLSFPLHSPRGGPKSQAEQLNHDGEWWPQGSWAGPGQGGRGWAGLDPQGARLGPKANQDRGGGWGHDGPGRQGLWRWGRFEGQG